MKHLPIITLCLFLSFSGFSQSTAALDEANGFKSLKFGTPQSTFSGRISEPVTDNFTKNLSYGIGFCSFTDVKEQITTAFGEQVRVDIAFDHSRALYLTRLETISDVQTSTTEVQQSWYQKLLNEKPTGKPFVSRYSYKQYSTKEMDALKNTISRAFGKPYFLKYYEENNRTYIKWQGNNVRLILEVGQFGTGLYSATIYFMDIKRATAEKVVRKQQNMAKDIKNSNDF